MTVVVSWLLVKSTGGMLGVLAGRTQKQGSAEVSPFRVLASHLTRFWMTSVLRLRTRWIPDPQLIICLHDSSPHPHRSEITFRVGCVLCVPLPIRGECRLQTLQYPFSDGSLCEMQPNIEDGQTLRGSACPHLRALFIHLKDHSKQANELLHEPHTASF